jgi:hypothetical protein
LLTGKRFRMERGTLAVEGIGGASGKPSAVTVPAGTIVTVISGPSNGLVRVDWEGRILGMFEIDVNVHGTEIQDEDAPA